MSEHYSTEHFKYMRSAEAERRADWMLVKGFLSGILLTVLGTLGILWLLG